MVYLVSNQDGYTFNAGFEKKSLLRDQLIWVGSLTDQIQGLVRLHRCSGVGIKAQLVIPRSRGRYHS
jgi:hypothetical protein